MWVLKGEVADDEAVEGIRIASRVLQAIDRDVIDSWSGSDPKCNTVFEKFPSKIQGLSASSPVLFEALSFYAVLSGSKKMPQEIVALYESSMSELACIADPDRVSETLSVAIPNFAVSFSFYVDYVH
jgi:glyceraldehyde-3-phosphate dehydrogenase/erythrose-4-phosphate dehydrogenase